MKLFGANLDVTGGASDFWSYVREPRPHRWALWGLAVTITFLVMWGVSEKLVRYDAPKSRIVYIESWRADRSDAEVMADRVARAKEVTRRNAERRVTYQRLADSLGIDYDSTEADKLTRETLGAEADEIGKQPEIKKSTLAERAARGAPPPP